MAYQSDNAFEIEGLANRRSIIQFSTTPTLEGRDHRQNIGCGDRRSDFRCRYFRDFFAGIRDIVGGRSGAYEKDTA
ncbi:heavy metal-binding domain-containing protein [Shigella boydii]